MGKNKKKQKKNLLRNKRSVEKAQSEEDIDVFAEQRDKIDLSYISQGLEDMAASDGDDVREDDRAILDLPESDEEQEEFEDEEEEPLSEESKDESDFDEEDTTPEIKELLEKERAINEQLKRLGATDSEDENVALNKKSKLIRWGQNKSKYYGPNTQEEDEESLEDDEEEDGAIGGKTTIKAIQKDQLKIFKDSDFGIDNDDSDSSATSIKDDQKKNSTKLESLEKNIEKLNNNEDLSAILSDSPELMILMEELKESFNELRFKIVPLLKETREEGILENEGLAYLEIKHMLLLHYCICIVYYLLLKLEGVSVRNHAVVSRLVEVRAYIEKIKPIDDRLNYQIEKLLRIAKLSENYQPPDSDKEIDEADLMPHPEDLIPKGGLGEKEAGGIYRPPRINPMAMEEEEKKWKENKPRSDSEWAERDIMDEIAREISGAPEEIGGGGDRSMCHLSSKMKEKLKEIEELEKLEEDRYTRSTVTKTQKKELEKVGLKGNVVYDKFEEDMNATLKAIAKINRKNEDLDTELEETMKGEKPSSGRGEERIKKQDRRKVEMSGNKKNKRMKPPKEFPVTDGPRGITKNIQKNRGLTSYKRRSTKNPRSHHREKFTKAEKKRKGHFQGVKEGRDKYGGESSGIRKNLSKSVRFK